MFKKAMIAGAVLAAAFGAQAQSASLTVTGTITPMPCSVTLGSAGNVDYSTVTAATVKGYTVFTQGSNTPAYTMPVKTISMNVACGAPTAVAITTVDNRAASKIPLSTNDANKYGMGKADGVNIGSYAIFFNSAGNSASTTYKATAADTAKAPAGYLTRAKGTSGAWTATSGASSAQFYPANALAIKQAASDTVPGTLTSITSTLGIAPYVSKPLVDAATTAITLDGSATLDLEYL